MRRFATAKTCGPTRGTANEQSVVECDHFHGRLHLVDLKDINPEAEEFQGRIWLEEVYRDRVPLGCCIEWPSDRKAEDDNDVALIAIASASTAVLLRTRDTHRFLPFIVKQLLSDPLQPKSCISFVTSGASRKLMVPMNDTKSAGVMDLGQLAAKKGVDKIDLSSLVKHVGLRMPPKPRSLNWAAAVLSNETQAYAADCAYLTLRVCESLEHLEDIATLAAEVKMESCLSMDPAWNKQWIKRTNEGLVCKLCGTGTMQHADVMRKHLESRNHRKKAGLYFVESNKSSEGSLGIEGVSAAGQKTLSTLETNLAMDAGWREEGIHVTHEGLVCDLCKTGGMIDAQAVRTHQESKGHQSRIRVDIQKANMHLPIIAEESVDLPAQPKETLGSSKLEFCQGGVLPGVCTVPTFLAAPSWTPYSSAVVGELSCPRCSTRVLAHENVCTKCRWPRDPTSVAAEPGSLQGDGSFFELSYKQRQHLHQLQKVDVAASRMVAVVPHPTTTTARPPELGLLCGASDLGVVKVYRVKAGSVASKCGFQVGDVITAVNGDCVRTAAEFHEKFMCYTTLGEVRIQGRWVASAASAESMHFASTE